MKKTAISIFLCTLTLSLTGCGSDSSPIDSPTSVLFRGVVEDGPIENAKISLRDHENNILTVSPVVTDRDGAFSLQVPAGALFTNLSVVAYGGRDRATGVDFTGLEMRSPVALFTNDVTAMVISPLTTLVAELQDQGLSLAVAQNRLRDWLALPAVTNLATRPSTSLSLQCRALLLSKIALEIRAVATDINPFSRISSQMLATDSFDAALSNQEVMSALGLDLAAQARVRDLQSLLAAASSIEDAAFSYKREELTGIFAANVEQMLIDFASFDPLHAHYRVNLRLLAETTLQAAGSEVITLGGTIPQRMARYILFSYQFRTWESLTLDPAAFAGALQRVDPDSQQVVLLSSDPLIAELARSRSLYSVVSPLLPTELPGNDNQQRLAYFYGSDLSPHFQAEQLVGQVFDDAINDAVLLKIIEGKANAGLIDETRAIIATQMVQSEPKANAYRALANALIKYNRPEEARRALDLARELYRKVIAAKGVASATATDVFNLYATSSAYRKAGDLANAQNLLDDVAVIAQALASDAGIYGRLITGIKNVTDAYIAAGDLEAAAPLVEAMDYYAGSTPANLGTYKLRIYNWSESAKRYADLGNATMVMQINDKIQALRAADGLQNLTKTATWVYVPSLVESLYRVGETQTALDLANTIPGGSIYLASAFKLVAIYEALQDNLQSAFTIADNVTYFPKGEDRLELLTYFAANKKNPGIALSLINAGRLSDARIVLEKAEGLLESMTQSSNLARIRYGFVKVAELYALMGERTKATALLQRAEAEIIVDVDAYRVAVMVDIALGYHNLDPGSTAVLPLLASAQNLADADPTPYRADTTPNLSPAEATALLYEMFVKAYEKIGEKGLVRTTTVNSLLPWSEEIYTGTTPGTHDALAGKECDYLLRAALYLDRAGYHEDALNVIAAAKETVPEIADLSKRLMKYLSVVTTYAAVHNYEQGLNLALSLKFTTERNQAIQALANATIDRDDFPASTVASIDNDGDGYADFFHPLASAEEIAASGLSLDDDSDGDGIVDTLDLRPLFAD